ncbi:MAG: hypothetical protein J7501_12870 [Bdellovibrio sp.]|nr:hypothetical protein [Bdellovibrio sp.]
MNATGALLRLDEQLSSEFLINELYEKSQKITAFIKSRGYPIKDISANVAAKIQMLPVNHLNKIYKDFSFLEELIATPEIEKQTETDITKEVLNRTKLKVSDAFWKRHRSDEVIEIYRNDGVQVFRSFNMFATTGYSFLDLNLYAWDELWERSSRRIADLHKTVDEILAGKIEDYVYEDEGEIIKEVLNTTFTEPFQPRMLATRVHQLTACRDILTNEIRGFAVTTSSKVLSIGKDSETIRFI